MKLEVTLNVHAITQKKVPERQVDYACHQTGGRGIRPRPRGFAYPQRPVPTNGAVSVGGMVDVDDQ